MQHVKRCWCYRVELTLNSREPGSCVPLRRAGLEVSAGSHSAGGARLNLPAADCAANQP